jgi:hypothetical protein
MNRARLIAITGVAALFAAGCNRAEPTAPATLATTASFAKVGASCAVDVGTTVNPLNAVHELEALMGLAIASATSSVNCGQTRSLDAKMEALAKALDQTPPNFHAACGVSGAIVNELTSLISGGQLFNQPFPPPFPGGPTNLLAAAEDLHGRWCAAARGELTGPRS